MKPIVINNSDHDKLCWLSRRLQSLRLEISSLNSSWTTSCILRNDHVWNLNPVVLKRIYFALFLRALKTRIARFRIGGDWIKIRQGWQKWGNMIKEDTEGWDGSSQTAYQHKQIKWINLIRLCFIHLAHNDYLPIKPW